MCVWLAYWMLYFLLAAWCIYASCHAIIFAWYFLLLTGGIEMNAMNILYILFCITFDLPSLAFGSILLENWWDFRVLTHTIALYTPWVSSECRVSEHRPHTLGDFVLHPYFLILTDFRMQYTFSIWITLPSPSWLLYQLSFRLLRGNERSAERPRHFIHESSLLGSKIKQKTGFWCNNSLYFFSSVVCNLSRKWHCSWWMTQDSELIAHLQLLWCDIHLVTWEVGV